MRREADAIARARAVADALRKPRGPLPIAKAKRTGPRGMNKLEAAWAEVLRAREMRGEVLWWRYEGISLRLADGAWYTPDFAVVVASGEMELHETKGSFCREAALVRLKVAAETFPMRFVLVKRDAGVWSEAAIGVEAAA